MIEFARTQRLKLVPLSREAVIAALDDRTKFAELVAPPNSQWPLPDMHDLLRLVRSMLEHSPEVHPYLAVIVLLNENQVIGDIGFHTAPVAGQVEIGYSVVPDFRNQGIAVEAVVAFSEWGFKNCDLERIQARCEPDNLASQRVLEKAGYKPRVSEHSMLNFEKIKPVAGLK